MNVISQGIQNIQAIEKYPVHEKNEFVLRPDLKNLNKFNIKSSENRKKSQ